MEFVLPLLFMICDFTEILSAKRISRFTSCLKNLYAFQCNLSFVFIALLCMYGGSLKEFEGRVDIRIFIFLSRKLLYFFLGLCYYSEKFPKMFCSPCGMEFPLTANFCHQCGQQLNLSQVSNKAATSVNKEKLLKEYVHRRYPYAAIVSLLENVMEYECT